MLTLWNNRFNGNDVRILIFSNSWATVKGCQLYWVLLTIKLDFKGLEGNIKDVDFLKKDIISSLNKTLALKMREYHSKVSWSLAFVMHGTFEL